MVRYFSDAQSKDRFAEYSFTKIWKDQPLPGHLFHYTTAPGLLGMISSRSVWMSDAQMLNDAKEISYFKEIVQQAASNLINNVAGQTRPNEEKMLIGHLEKSAPELAGSVFVASFSEHRDQLSQWRAYTDDSTGFNLGFPAASLQTIVERCGFILVKCCYDYRSAYNAALELIQSFLAWKAEEPTIDVDTWGYEFARQTMLAAPIFKHRSFSEEAEWRVYEFAALQEERLEFRSTRRAIIPYIKLPLNGIVKRGWGVGDPKFLLIPGPGQRYSPTSGQGIFWKYFGTFPSVSVSETPYRTE